jgi:Uma2 family endonuclease
LGKPQRKRYTWDDYVLLPDDGKRYEILEGDLVVSPAPIMDHQFTVLMVTLLLGDWWRSRGAGLLAAAPSDVVLADDTVCQPDVFWIAAERVSEIVDDRVYGIPDLVVEVLSPSTSRRDRTKKADIYAKHGAREYWLFDPGDQSVEIRVLREGRFVRHAFGTGDVELVSTIDDQLRIIPAGLFRKLSKKRRKRPTS